MSPQLKIAVHVPDTTNVRAMMRTYDPLIDDIRSILLDICEAISEQGEFIVAGFGQDRWPVDVGTDLPILLEQLPKVLQAVKAGIATEIDFYEQGIERRIEFSPDGNTYRATCISLTEWQPNPATEKVDRIVLAEMLSDVQTKMVNLIQGIAPALVEHDWVRRWLNGETVN